MLVSLYLLARSHINDNWKMLWHRITRLGILLFVEYRLQLVGRRRFYIVNITLLYGHSLADKDVLTIRTPLDAIAVIAAYSAVLSKDSLGFCIRFSCLMNHYIITFYISLHLAIRR